MKPLLLPTILAALGGACSPGPAPVSHSLHDPSNPSAAEGVSPLGAVGRSEPETPAAGEPHAPSGHGAHTHPQGRHDHGVGAGKDAGGALGVDGDASAGAYVCPMHPEVTAAGPGRCPKCGMNLVAKK